jgi:hypothetical protein
LAGAAGDQQEQQRAEHCHLSGIEPTWIGSHRSSSSDHSQNPAAHVARLR